jgi:hypothetical protein
VLDLGANNGGGGNGESGDGSSGSLCPLLFECANGTPANEAFTPAYVTGSAVRFFFSASFFFRHCKSHSANKQISDSPASPPMTPPIMAGFWILEDVEEVEDCNEADGDVEVVDVNDADVGENSAEDAVDDWSVVDAG